MPLRVSLSCITMYAFSNMSYLLSVSDVTVWSEGTCDIVFRLHADSFPYWECIGDFINYFPWTRGSPYFKRNSAEFSVEFQVLENFFSLV